MGESKSQYSGTLKDSICTFCGKHLNNMTREQQDKHSQSHEGQGKLI